MTITTIAALTAPTLAVIAAALYLGRIFGALPGQIAEAVRGHEEKCLNYEHHTAVNIKAVPAPEV